jgi:hypothetical protein
MGQYIVFTTILKQFALDILMFNRVSSESTFLLDLDS